MAILNRVEDVATQVRTNVQGFLNSSTVMNSLRGLSDEINELRRRCGTMSDCLDFLPPSLDPARSIETFTDEFDDVSGCSIALNQLCLVHNSRN